MGFNISELYEQTGMAFYLCLNLLISIIYVTLLFPSDQYRKVIAFVAQQVIFDGRMQSGNISIIFVGALITAFLLNHLSNWAESVLYPKMSINPNNFAYLIAHRFWNIATLFNANELNKSLNDAVNSSYEQIFSQENPKSNITRLMGVRQRKWRFYKVFAGTFKMGYYSGTLLALYQLFFKFDFIAIAYYLSIAVGSLLLWFLMDIILCNIIWNMFNSFWGYQEVYDGEKGSYLNNLFGRKYLEYWQESFRKITLKQRIHDIKSGWIIRWK